MAGHRCGQERDVTAWEGTRVARKSKGLDMTDRTCSCSDIFAPEELPIHFDGRLRVHPHRNMGSFAHDPHNDHDQRRDRWCDLGVSDRVCWLLLRVSLDCRDGFDVSLRDMLLKQKDTSLTKHSTGLQLPGVNTTGFQNGRPRAVSDFCRILSAGCASLVGKPQSAPSPSYAERSSRD